MNFPQRTLISHSTITSLISIGLVSVLACSCSDESVSEDAGQNTAPEFDIGVGDTDVRDDDPDTLIEDDVELEDVEIEAGNTQQVTWDPFEMGDFSVARHSIDDAPVELLAFAPEESGDYPPVVFQHGFLMANSHYGDLLEHLASHGFIVLAPQMYDPGGLPWDAPSTEEEAQLASELYDWIEVDLGDHIDVGVSSGLGLAGHSRGAKVLWWSLREDPRSVDAVAGVDPVDGTGGPLGGEPRVLDDPPTINAPIHLIGTGLGSESPSGFEPACAPEDENYEAFFAAVASPAWQVVATEYGHLDMLDDDPEDCGIECDVCVEGESREPMRILTGGMMAALFRATLHGEEWAFGFLDDESSAPVFIETESK